MTERFPGYDVLAKRDTLSWNEPTRRAVDKRLAVSTEPRFFNAAEWQTLGALCARLLPQPADRPPVPIPAYIDEKLFLKKIDGYRFEPLPPQDDAWRIGLAALDQDARERHGQAFHELGPEAQDALIQAMQDGELDGPHWRGMPAKLFFAKRAIHDTISAYYAHPTAWNELGWSGPASPRGYVRLDADMRDPWEAAEAYPGKEEQARRENRRVV